MEEEIKVLEHLINDLKKKRESPYAILNENFVELDGVFLELNYVINSLENLIKGYKELDKENTRQHDLLGKIHEKYQKNYIPKLKVREKIEKWESICRAEQLEGLNDNHAEYWSCFEDVLEKIKEQLLQEGDK